MKDEGFLLVDTLLGLLTFSIIITVLIPAMLALERLEQQSEEHLTFTRDVYLHLMNNDSLIIDDDFFSKGAICRDEHKKICLE